MLVFAASLVLSPLVISDSLSGPKIRLSGGWGGDCSVFAVNAVGGKSGCRSVSWGGSR
ncbi:hypothetical protein ILP92_14935 [Maribius pontilimi]|uniref:Uncharacterized protein n=1 Tax=Palleronia pontilimi TaxID=1964209 RepID=A0A934MDL4_9RHOB|nr:hypothetical protein [Palleronia pontilimi]MBJ3764043.1 hypothetical protein [Palleronia pontilimi]